MTLSGNSSSQNECKWVVVTLVISIVACGQEKWAVWHSLLRNVSPFSYKHDYCSPQLFWLLYGCSSRKIRVSRLTRNHLSKMVQKLRNLFRVTWQALDGIFWSVMRSPISTNFAALNSGMSVYISLESCRLWRRALWSAQPWNFTCTPYEQNVEIDFLAPP
jgi:hypothetical protein